MEWIREEYLCSKSSFLLFFYRPADLAPHCQSSPIRLSVAMTARCLRVLLMVEIASQEGGQGATYGP